MGRIVRGLNEWLPKEKERFSNNSAKFCGTRTERNVEVYRAKIFIYLHPTSTSIHRREKNLRVVGEKLELEY
jgi:hypothetical protein